MIPKILEYEDKRVKVTAEAYSIPEIKTLIDKYDMKVEPYLAYVYHMTALDSTYVNIAEEDRQEAVLYDIQQTLGEFDWQDQDVSNAVDRLKSLYTGPMTQLALEARQELHRLRMWLRDTPYGDEENVKTRIGLLKDLEKVATAYEKILEQAKKESTPQTRGDHEVGDY